MDGHWRDSIRIPRFTPMFDARAALTLAVLLIYPRPITFVMAFVSMIFFYILERLGLTFDAALRRFRAWLCGVERPATGAGSQRRLLDTHRFEQ